MNALILAAGMGSRLMPLTKNQPKCMVDFKEKKIIDYEIETLKNSGIEKIGVVGGYLFEILKSYLLKKDISIIYQNTRFHETNMVATLFSAKEFLLQCVYEEKDLIISYSDIIYSSSVVENLIRQKEEFSIVVDLKWKEMWEKRFENPLDDAETLKMQQGRVIELGKKPKALCDIQGQYIGLFKFSHTFLPKVIEAYDNMDRNIMYDDCCFEKMYMTSFLQYLIDLFHNAHAVCIEGGWIEIDSRSDLETMQDANITD